MIKLRDVCPEDAEKLRTWRNLPEISRYMYTDHFISAKEHETWFRGALADPTRRYWIITCDGEDVGLVNLYALDHSNRRCYWAFYVVPGSNVKGKSVGSLVEFEILRHVFEDLGFNKLCCEVLAFNRGVVRMHTGFGFREEGRFRQHVRKGDEFVDVVCMAILKEEWERKKPALEARLAERALQSGGN